MWRGGADVYVTYNTYGTLHDVQLTNFDGDHYNLLRRIGRYRRRRTGGCSCIASTSVQPVEVEQQAGGRPAIRLQPHGADGRRRYSPDPYLVLYDENGML